MDFGSVDSSVFGFLVGLLGVMTGGDFFRFLSLFDSIGLVGLGGALLDFLIDEDDLVVGEMEADFGVVSLLLTQIKSLNDEDFSNVIPLGGEREWPFGVFVLF